MEQAKTYYNERISMTPSGPESLMMPIVDDKTSIALEMGEDATDAELNIEQDEDTSPSSNNPQIQEQNLSVPEENFKEAVPDTSEKKHKYRNRRTESERINQKTEEIYKLKEFGKTAVSTIDNLKKELSQKDQENLYYKEQAYKAKREHLEEMLTDAQEKGDSELASKILNSMSRLNVALDRVEEAKKSDFQYETPIDHIVPDFQEYAKQPVVNPYYEEWYQRNMWFGKSEALTKKAQEIGEKLESLCYYHQRPDLIGSPEYFQALDTEIADYMGINQNPPSQQPYYEQNVRTQNLPQRRPPSNVVGANRGNSLAQSSNRTSGNAQYELSPMEKEAAYNMEYGLPAHPQGRPYSKTELEKIYINSMKKRG